MDRTLNELLELRLRGSLSSEGIRHVAGQGPRVPVGGRLGPPPGEALGLYSDATQTPRPALPPARLRQAQIVALLARMEAEARRPAVDVAYCVVGLERGFGSSVVYESLRKNVVKALNGSIGAYLAAGADGGGSGDRGDDRGGLGANGGQGVAGDVFV